MSTKDKEQAPDDIYTDPRLAAVYEVLNPPAADTEFYLSLGGDMPMTILDMGCGTGLLACGFAKRGHRVTGADPAVAMLDIARRRPGGDSVTWVHSDAAGLNLDTRFDLIIMTGHVFQVFLTDEEIKAVLRTLHNHLAPGGRLAFETRNLDVHPWEAWTPDKTRERVGVPGLGLVEVHHDVRVVDLPLVTFDTCFRFDNGDDVTASSTLRFMNQDELAGLLFDAGFMDITWHGYWDRSPIDMTSPEIIAIARVAD